MARVPTEQRKLELISAAVEVIAENGVAGATTRMIADRAESPLTMIHYCFGGKEDLFYAIFEHMAWSQFEELLHVRPAMGLGRAAGTVMRQLGAWLYEEGGYARAQNELFLWVTRQDTDRARKAYDFSLNVFTAKLRVGLRPGDAEELVDPLARMILAYADGSILHDLAYRDKALHQANLDAMAEAMEMLAEAHRIAPAAATA